MRVVVPYTVLTQGCEPSLERYAPHAERVYVGDDVTAYWRTLAELWEAGEDFAVVEHDVVISERTLEGFEACPQAWCVCSDPEWGFSQLQCVRFRAELMAAIPNALDLPPWMRHWVMQDQNLLPKLRVAGYRPHEHSDTPTRHRPRGLDETHAQQMGFYAWLANFATMENEMLLVEMEPGLERDRLALAFLLSPLAKFAERDLHDACRSA